MSTRQAALRAEAAASSAPVTASPRRFGLPSSATRTASSRHLRADPGDLQRHVGRAQQRLPRPFPALPVVAGLATGVEHGRVGPGVHVGQLRRHQSQLVGLVRQLPGRREDWGAENRAAMATSPAAIAPVTAAATPPPGAGVRAAT